MFTTSKKKKSPEIILYVKKSSDKNVQIIYNIQGKKNESKNRNGRRKCEEEMSTKTCIPGS